MQLYSYIRLNGELVDYEPVVEEEHHHDLGLDEDTIDYYASLLELGAGIWAPGNMEPSDTLKERFCDHQQVKSIKKSNKKKSKEQRAKKKSVRFHAIPELEVEDASD